MKIKQQIRISKADSNYEKTCTAKRKFEEPLAAERKLIDKNVSTVKLQRICKRLKKVRDLRFILRLPVSTHRGKRRKLSPHYFGKKSVKAILFVKEITKYVGS